MEIGIYTFAELRRESAADAGISAEQRLRNLLEEIELAEQASTCSEWASIIARTSQSRRLRWCSPRPRREPSQSA